MIQFDTCENKTDEELVGLTLKDQGYFLYLIKRYEIKLLNYIQRISSFNKEEAEDILQEVFIRVYKNLNAFDQSLKFSSWIYRITHNQVISHYRKTKARPQIIILDENNNFLENLVSDLDLIEEINLKEVKNKIYQTLAKLDIKYREILILKFLEQKNYKEISDILKKPIGTIATLIHRAKQQFKKEYGK